MTLFRLRTVSFAAAALMVAMPALAGPPLLCFPFAIGKAASLPFGGGSWQRIDPQYDPSHLADDTVALLTAQTPVVVRMETLRRATIYAAKHPRQAAALLDRLQQRASRADANAALAVFDFGYLAETYKQASYLFGGPYKAVQHIDGYNLVAKAAAMTGDPSIEFALAVMTRDRTRGADVYRAHLVKTLKAAESDAMIQANVTAQFGNDLDMR